MQRFRVQTLKNSFRTLNQFFSGNKNRIFLAGSANNHTQYFKPFLYRICYIVDIDKACVPGNDTLLLHKSSINNISRPLKKGAVSMERQFDPKHMHRLDSPERRKILPPEEILNKLNVKKGDVFIDIGCGTGYFSIPASKIVGQKGKVFAFDTSVEMINELNGSISENKIKNITVMQSLKYKLPIPDCTGTLALASSVLHEVEDGKSLLMEIYRVLCTEGRLCVIEWQKKETPEGPPIVHKLDPAEVRRAVEEAGFRFEISYTIGDFFIAYTAIKQ